MVVVPRIGNALPLPTLLAIATRETVLRLELLGNMRPLVETQGLVECLEGCVLLGRPGLALGHIGVLLNKHHGLRQQA